MFDKLLLKSFHNGALRAQNETSLTNTFEDTIEIRAKLMRLRGWREDFLVLLEISNSTVAAMEYFKRKSVQTENVEPKLNESPGLLLSMS
jgi:hypothetical protein